MNYREIKRIADLIDGIEDVYNQKHHLRFEPNEFKIFDFRITFNALPISEDEDYEDVEARDYDFRFSIGFDNNGLIVFKILSRNEYSITLEDLRQMLSSHEKHGSRRYYFSDVIVPSISREVNKIIETENFRDIYIWNRFSPNSLIFNRYEESE